MIYNVTAHVMTEQHFSVIASNANEAKAFAAAYVYTSPDRYPMFEDDVRPTRKKVALVDILNCKADPFRNAKGAHADADAYGYENEDEDQYESPEFFCD